MKKRVLLAALALLSLTAAECTSADRADRSVDFTEDATEVTLVRNADDVPNVVLFCAGGERFASTLSSDGAKNPALLHLGSCEGPS